MQDIKIALFIEWRFLDKPRELMVPKAGLEPARISTVDFESTASTDFATSALKRYAENVVNYTCHAPPCKRQLVPASLSAENFSIVFSDM